MKFANFEKAESWGRDMAGELSLNTAEKRDMAGARGREYSRRT